MELRVVISSTVIVFLCHVVETSLIVPTTVPFTLILRLVVPDNVLASKLIVTPSTLLPPKPVIEPTELPTISTPYAWINGTQEPVNESPFVKPNKLLLYFCDAIFALISFAATVNSAFVAISSPTWFLTSSAIRLDIPSCTTRPPDFTVALLP